MMRISPFRSRNQAWFARLRVLCLATLLIAGHGSAQVVSTAPIDTGAVELDATTLEDLVAPIALYPDDLLAIILPASTFPLDIVQAARFLEELDRDASLAPDPEWDDSVVALLNYPEVLRLLNEDLDWTWALGEAVLTDQAAVLAAAQQFRSLAYDAGNLRSDDKQLVSYSDHAIRIKSADPEVIYVPVYEPREVIVLQPTPVYRYYPTPYPVYYYPYPAGYSFGIDFFWGVTSYFSLGWGSHYVHVHHHTHRLHPYYLNSFYYYRPFYPRSRLNVTVSVDRYANVWQPSPRRGARPRTITTESRSSTVRPRRENTTETQPNLTSRSRTTATAQQDSRGSTRRSTSNFSGTSSRSTAAANRSETGRSETGRSGTGSTRAVESQAESSSQTRSVRSGNPATPQSGQATRARTRQPAISVPATRPQVTAPPSAQRATSAQRSTTTRSTMTSSGSSRRTQSAAPAPAPAPQARSQSSGSGNFGGTRQGGAPGGTTRTRQR